AATVCTPSAAWLAAACTCQRCLGCPETSGAHWRLAWREVDDIEQQLLLRGPLDHLIVMQPRLVQGVWTKSGTTSCNHTAQHDSDCTSHAPPPNPHATSPAPARCSHASVYLEGPVRTVALRSGQSDTSRPKSGRGDGR